MLFIRSENSDNTSNSKDKKLLEYDRFALSSKIKENLDDFLARKINIDNFAIKMEEPSIYTPKKNIPLEIIKYFLKNMITILGIFIFLMVVYEKPKDIVKAFKNFFPKRTYLSLLKKNNDELYRVSVAAYNRKTGVLSAVSRFIVENYNNKRNGCVPPISQHRNFLLVGPTGSGKSFFKRYYDILGLSNEQIAMQNITAPGYIGKNYTKSNGISKK